MNIINLFYSRAEESLFCVKKDDQRWQPMCSNPLSKCVRDRLLGDEECKSPFGTYELQIPVDKQLRCASTSIADKNCKDLDVSIIHPQTQAETFIFFRIV